MSVLATDKVSDGSTDELSAAPQETKLHRGPVARLLTKVSQWAGDYAEYQVEYQLKKCAWQKMSI